MKTKTNLMTGFFTRDQVAEIHLRRNLEHVKRMEQEMKTLRENLETLIKAADRDVPVRAMNPDELQKAGVIVQTVSGQAMEEVKVLQDLSQV